MKYIDDKLLERFKRLVSDHIGFCIREGDNETFRKALIAEMKRLNIVEPAGYLCFLESDTVESKQQWKTLIISITTGESYFFRDKGHFFLLQSSILPELIKNKEIERSLRIWCAGCSTGEEPYSVAILLDMLLEDKRGWNIFITGTDINDESVKKAKRGRYSPWSFRLVDKAIKEKYFKRRQDEWEINENIKKMVNFQYGNLIEDGFFSQKPELCNMDIIICRNVFIYFNKEAVASVLDKFINALNDGGYLITGHGELRGHDLMNLSQIMYPEAVIYKKTLESKRRTPEIALSPEVRKEKKDLEFKIKPVLKSPLAVSVSSNKKPMDPKPDIGELIKKGRCTEAINKAEGLLNKCKDDIDMLCLMAQAYANSGDYDKAESVCRGAMNINANAADPYFLLANIAEARGNDEEAKDLFRKAIYLNPSFIAAYCELAGIYEKGNDIPRAKKARSTAIELLKYLPSSSSVKPYDITAGELLAYVLALIRPGKETLVLSGEKSRR